MLISNDFGVVDWVDGSSHTFTFILHGSFLNHGTSIGCMVWEHIRIFQNHILFLRLPLSEADAARGDGHCAHPIAPFLTGKDVAGHEA